MSDIYGVAYMRGVVNKDREGATLGAVVGFESGKARRATKLRGDSSDDREAGKHRRSKSDYPYSPHMMTTPPAPILSIFFESIPKREKHMTGKLKHT